MHSSFTTPRSNKYVFLVALAAPFGGYSHACSISPVIRVLKKFVDCGKLRMPSLAGGGDLKKLDEHNDTEEDEHQRSSADEPLCQQGLNTSSAQKERVPWKTENKRKSASTFTIQTLEEERRTQNGTRLIQKIR